VIPCDPLELLKEALVPIPKGQGATHLRFRHTKAWRESAIVGQGRRSEFISTEGTGADRVVKRHQEGKAGRTLALRATDLPRTVLSAANASESPTALLARREMQSWRLLQLEPSALRRPASFTAPARLGADGSHLAATLYRLARSNRNGGAAGDAEEVYARVANRLSELIGDVRSVSVDRDERRELLTLMVSGRDRTAHPARALSDGTLRFLALSTIELDPASDRVLCLEEPENGVHPGRISAILNLLRAICTDPQWPADADNPPRQVVVNTHSPLVVAEVQDDELLVAESQQTTQGAQAFERVMFKGLPGTWRADAEGGAAIPRGRLMAYLNPLQDEDESRGSNGRRAHTGGMRVMDRPDLQALLPFGSGDG
jgi:predicted ATPase